MRDINLPLRKAYTTALTGLNVAGKVRRVFYQMAPDNIQDEAYIVLSNVANTDNSTFSSANTVTAFQVAIRTFDAKYNTGELADQIANAIFAIIYPDSRSNLNLTADGIQMYSTRVQLDFVQDYGVKNNRVYLDRIIQFSHRFFIQSF